jgi:hypothetical protein
MKPCGYCDQQHNHLPIFDFSHQLGLLLLLIFLILEQVFQFLVLNVCNVRTILIEAYPISSKEYKPKRLILFDFLIEITVVEISDTFQGEDPDSQDKE